MSRRLTETAGVNQGGKMERMAQRKSEEARLAACGIAKRVASVVREGASGRVTGWPVAQSARCHS